MNSSTRLLLYSAAIGFIVSATTLPVSAGVVTLYDNFGPNTTFNLNPNNAWWVYSYFNFPPIVSGDQFAFSFTPSQTATLDKIYLPLDIFNDGGINEVMVGLMHDNNGSPGNVMFYQQTSANIPKGDFSVGSPAIVALDPFLKPVLQAGTQYWVAARLDNVFNSSARWYATTTDTTSPAAATRLALFENSVPVWYLQPNGRGRGAFRVTGTVTVPEPGSLVLFSAAVLFLSRRSSLHH